MDNITKEDKAIINMSIIILFLIVAFLVLQAYKPYKPYKPLNNLNENFIPWLDSGIDYSSDRWSDLEYVYYSDFSGINPYPNYGTYEDKIYLRR